ncbi:MAG: hypothetical protein SVY10_01630, partial [Thermodesulfobacteriota bacterium]|nr:hypothetical protein [Thermodesulfobacteriota bacterium]
DNMHKRTDLATNLVVIDEAHFLGDEDRGVVWEEVMIYLPEKVHLLLLSATVKNAHHIATWLESIRSKPCVVVEETRRPVPLFPLFMHPGGRFLPMMDSGKIDKKVRSFMSNPNPSFLTSPRQIPPFGEIIAALEKYNLLPAIFFLKSRADCDAALKNCVPGLEKSPAEWGKLNEKINELIKGHSCLFSHQQLKYLREAGVAAHHSGQLPAWKLVIEHLMNNGMLHAVFATSTVAAGVNFPARCVVFLNSDRYNGREFVPMNATEFHQMTGRAGRRGKDNIGFAVMIPGKFMDMKHMANLCTSPPEDVYSQIKVDFSMVLNLLLSHNPEEIEDIFEKSFATYVNLINRQPEIHRKLNEAGEKMRTLLPEALCEGPESALDLIRKRVSLTSEFSSVKQRLKRAESKLLKLAYLVPGRLFLDGRDRMYCVMQQETKKDEQGVMAIRIQKEIPRRGKRPGMKWFRPERVSRILDCVIELQDSPDPRKMSKTAAAIVVSNMPSPLNHMTLGEEGLLKLEPLIRRRSLIEQQIEELPCSQCSHFKMCHGKTKGAFRGVFEEFASLWDTVNSVRVRLWNDWVKHFEFLREEGFVNEDGTLSDDGVWASQLRLDQPLLIAEGLRKGIFPITDPPLLAALIAPFLYDREMDMNFDESIVPKQLLRAYKTMRHGISPLMERKATRGFEVRPVTLWPAATIYAWANGQSWEEVITISEMAEGDLAMLVSRTADNLRQIASLTKVYPDIARSALDAISLIMRDPVVMELGLFI